MKLQTDGGKKTSLYIIYTYDFKRRGYALLMCIVLLSKGYLNVHVYCSSGKFRDNSVIHILPGFVFLQVQQKVHFH